MDACHVGCQKTKLGLALYLANYSDLGKYSDLGTIACPIYPLFTITGGLGLAARNLADRTISRRSLHPRQGVEGRRSGKSCRGFTAPLSGHVSRLLSYDTSSPR